MIHIQKIRINCNNKLYKRSPKNLFVQNEVQLDELLKNYNKKFIYEKYPDGIPAQYDGSRTPFCTTDSTHITVPDREFLYYLATELKMKTIPEKFINLLRSKI